MNCSSLCNNNNQETTINTSSNINTPSLVTSVLSQFLCKLCSEILYSPNLSKCCGETACYNCFFSMGNVCCGVLVCPFCRQPNLKIMPNFKIQQMKEMIIKKYNINSGEIPQHNKENECNRIKLITIDNFASNNYNKIPYSHIFNSAKFFIMKSFNLENISISQIHNQWATTKTNQRKLNDAFRESFVILLFSVNRSRSFQGYAIMTSYINNISHSGNKKKYYSDKSNYSTTQKMWKVAEDFQLGASFSIKWMVACEFPFDRIRNVRNPLNNNEPLAKSRDTQELPMEIGVRMCNMLYERRRGCNEGQSCNSDIEEVVKEISDNRRYN